MLASSTLTQSTHAEAVDMTKPTVAISTDLTLAGGTKNVVNLTGMVLDDNLASYTLAVKDGAILQQGTGLTDTNISINVPWNVSTPQLLPSHSYVITLDATDKAGNTAHTETTVDVDNDGPTVALGGGDIIIRSGSITPVSTSSDPHGPLSYQWTANADNPSALEYAATASEPTFTPTVEGSYGFSVVVTDGLGNVSYGAFHFTYNTQELAPIPLPITADPTDLLVDSTPGTPISIDTAVTPVATSNPDTTATSDDTTVLGSAVTAAGQSAAVKSTGVIAPTNSGWSIFGLLWYWWLGIMSILIIGWRYMKKLTQPLKIQQP